MKKIISILLISNSILAQTAKLDTNTILIGQQINFTITNKVSNTEVWPAYDKFIGEKIEIIKSSKIDTIDEIIKQKFIITSWDSGSYYIPPIAFSKDNITEEILINIQTPILEENAKLKDIKKPIEESIGWSDIWPWLITILIIFLITYYLRKHLSNKKEITITSKPKIIVPSDITALRQLNKLEKEKIWQAGNVKEYHSQLSEIIRRYTENRFEFIALEMTTYEIIEELKSIVNLDEEELKNLRILLQRADLAKFAKSKPVDRENIESMSIAKRFVSSTKKAKGNE